MASLDAAVSGTGSFAGYLYFFRGRKYYRYDVAKKKVDYSSLIAHPDGWGARFFPRVDAALNGAGKYEGKAFFFYGDEYLRYTFQSKDGTGRVIPGGIDPDYPRKIAAWNGWTGFPSDFQQNLDTAVRGAGKYARYGYFFKNGLYIRWDFDADKLDPLVPASIALSWPGLPSDFGRDIRAAVLYPAPGGKTYFFKHRKAVCFDYDAGDQGSVVPCADCADLAKAAYEGVVDLAPPVPEVWMVFFDGAKKAAGDLRDHQDNVPRLAALIDRVFGAGRVRIKFKAIMQDAVDSINDPTPSKRRAWPLAPVERWDGREPGTRPFAIFSTGSFTWWEDIGDTDWKAALDQYMSFIKNTSIPFFGVCGSHQLVALTYGATVVHMINQLDATKNAHPKWDPGEKGTFPVRLVESAPPDDPIVRFWKGLAPPKTPGTPALTKQSDGNSALMALHHVNEVLDVPSQFTHLFTSEGTVGPYYREATLSTDGGADQTGTVSGATISTKTSKKPIDVWWTAYVSGLPWEAKRTTVQGMVLDDPDRLLYTTQFHPEVAGWGGGNDGGNGDALLTKFLEMADAWWRSHSSFTGF
jgi:hypothetical protein